MKHRLQNKLITIQLSRKTSRLLHGAGNEGIIVCSEWRFGVMSCLKGNCSYGDMECENGKSDRTYDARFTHAAAFKA
ncbi:MAG: hypothetical protein J6K97_00465 [Clostridia bacterium]|nr:hypothetical protein [Clostridia bacterium]